MERRSEGKEGEKEVGVRKDKREEEKMNRRRVGREGGRKGRRH